MAADQRLVVEHGGPPNNFLWLDDAFGDTSSTHAGRSWTSFSRDVQPAEFMARCCWADCRWAWLARGSFRWANGYRRPADSRAMADPLVGGCLVPAEYATDAGPLASGLQLRGCGT